MKRSLHHCARSLMVPPSDSVTVSKDCRNNDSVDSVDCRGLESDISDLLRNVEST